MKFRERWAALRKFTTLKQLKKANLRRRVNDRKALMRA